MCLFVLLYGSLSCFVIIDFLMAESQFKLPCMRPNSVFYRNNKTLWIKITYQNNNVYKAYRALSTPVPM